MNVMLGTVVILMLKTAIKGPFVLAIFVAIFSSDGCERVDKIRMLKGRYSYSEHS
jgi:hypothetical protein